MAGQRVKTTETERIVATTRPVGILVVLNGFPGTGKLSILRHVKKLLPVDRTCLFDNHLLIDPVVAVMPERSAPHYELRRKIRTPIFEKLRERAQQGCIVFMTACLAANNQVDASVFEEHLDIVRGTGITLFWLTAHCDQAVLEDRVSSPERCNGSKTKLTDVSVLRNLLQTHSLIDPENFSDRGVKLIASNIDVSGSVEQSAYGVMETIGVSNTSPMEG